MAEFFLNVAEKEPIKADFYKKRKCFQKEIRSKEIEKKIKQLRIMGTEGPHINSMAKALPLSWEDLIEYMIDHPQYHQAITKSIIDKIYHFQLSEQAEIDSDSTYFLLPENPPKTQGQFQKVIYFFSVLLEHQAIYAPNIFKRYLMILLEQSKAINALNYIFNLFIEVLKKPELCWAPIEEIIEAIKWIQKIENQKQIPIYSSEMETYFHLTNNYYQKVEGTEEIKNRIKLILEKGSDFLEPAKPKLFFKLCLNLTYLQNHDEQVPLENPNKNYKRPDAFFHRAMIKGGIFKNLYRHLFYSSKEKLRHLCLQVLRNLILECGGEFLWVEQKFNPIQRFEHEIRDTSNSMFLFKVFCEVFLISIVQLSRHEVEKIFQNEIDTLELILYILETVDKKSLGGKQIHQYAEESLSFMLQEGSKENQKTVMNKILQSRWKNALGLQSQLIQECQKLCSYQQ